ncbi:MAG: aminotransferase class V-fold PLP-dependent enzyme [Holosporales bacterium]|nr:aminotransferase class V-fold PLP-dependent enzyme [Holosporales bacterium]
MNKIIYLDYAATTPCDPRVLEEMLPYFVEKFGNSSSLHWHGQKALSALSAARGHVCELLNAEFEEIVFTSGATESTWITITRTIQSLSTKKQSRILTLKTEHKATLDCVNQLKANGISVGFLDIQSDGILDLQYLKSSITDDVGLLSICLVNNETGVLQDIKSIVEICHSKDVLVHVDATQAFGKIPVDVKALDIDFLSASGHKIYGPKGVGILYCKRKNVNFIKVPRANYDVEFGIRAGTVPVPLCVAIGKAAQIAKKEMLSDLKKIKRLRKRFITGVISRLDEIYINGSQTSNYSGIVNISFRGCEGEALMMEADKLAVSSGSACTSNRLSISHVLEAMGVLADIAQSSLRISIGKITSDNEIDVAIDSLIMGAEKLRQMSPVWDMIEAGVNVDKIFQRGCHAV